MNKARRSLLDERLAKTAACLESLDQHRKSHADPNFGRSFEKGLTWDELLDLELQEFEEEMKCQAEVAPSLVADAKTPPTQACGEISQRRESEGVRPAWWRLGRLFP